MLRHLGSLAFVVLALLAGGLSAAEDRSFHDEVLATYSFHPPDLTKSEFQLKVKALDSFWEKVKGRGAEGLSDLRTELNRQDTPTFFAYDGARLLLSLSTDRQDQELALRSIARVELRDIQWSDYFRTVHWFARQGFDTSEAALKVLDEEGWKVFIPQHALTLGQDFSLLYLTLPAGESVYLAKLMARLKDERSDRAQKSLLLVLGYSIMPEADKAIRETIDDESKSMEVRRYAEEIHSSITEQSKSVLAISHVTEEELRAERRELLHHVSDEALIELESIQAKLRRKVGVAGEA